MLTPAACAAGNVRLAFAFLMLFIVMPLAPAQAACSHEIATPLTLLPLYAMAQVDRLENENRLDLLCPPNAKACRAVALAPSHDSIMVYGAPDGKPVGELVITYTPGQGMAAVMRHDGQETAYIPTVFDMDWGYGPWFHATVLDRRDGWYRIALPFVGAGWVTLPDAEVMELAADTGRVYRIGDSEVMILGMEGSDVVMRDAQPADMWCADGTPPALFAFDKVRVPVGSLYTDACGLMLRPAYLRGC